MFSQGVFICILLVGFILTKTIVNWLGIYQFKSNQFEMVTFGTQLALIMAMFQITGLHNVSFDKNMMTIIIGYILGFIAMILLTRFAPITLYDNTSDNIVYESNRVQSEISTMTYYSIFAGMIFISLLFIIFDLATNELESLISQIVYVICVIVIYIMLVSSRRDGWIKNDAISVNDCDKSTKSNKCKDCKYGCCEHDPTFTCKKDPNGSNCDIYQKQVINKNYGIILWIVTILFYYSKNNDYEFGGIKQISLGWHFFVIAMFVGFSSIYKTEFPIKLSIFNLDQ